ncbi:hypothetical protein [Priestia aryabhattai]|nr:hypothetical protein [Priestia aryabhattai]
MNPKPELKNDQPIVIEGKSGEAFWEALMPAVIRLAEKKAKEKES